MRRGVEDLVGNIISIVLSTRFVCSVGEEKFHDEEVNRID